MGMRDEAGLPHWKTVQLKLHEHEDGQLRRAALQSDGRPVWDLLDLERGYELLEDHPQVSLEYDRFHPYLQPPIPGD